MLIAGINLKNDTSYFKKKKDLMDLVSKDKLERSMMLCCYGAAATIKNEAVIIAFRNFWGTCLKHCIMLLSCLVFIIFCWSFLIYLSLHSYPIHKVSTFFRVWERLSLSSLIPKILPLY